jgi:hypothetical protein
MGRLASEHTLASCPPEPQAAIRRLAHTQGPRHFQPAMTHRPTNTRDAALRRLSSANRWLLAGSVALTGVFAELAAQAFPGKTVKASSATRAPANTSHKASSTTTTKSLQPPAQAPQASTTPEPTIPHETAPQESAPSHESSRSQESASSGDAAAPSQEAAPARESAPAPESQPARESAPVKEGAPARETAPAQESAPVVSGGS